MSKVQEYLAKKKLEQKIKEENLPVMYVVSSSSKGVKPIREIQVANIKKNSGARFYSSSVKGIILNKYTFSEFEDPSYKYLEFNIEQGATSDFVSNYNGGGNFGSLDKSEAEKYFEKETLRIKEEYNPDLKNDKFYWIKLNDDSDWEVARYKEETNTMHLTDGSFQSVKSIVEIYQFPLNKNDYGQLIVS